MPVVRPATARDGRALHRLSHGFAVAGALRERSVASYVRAAHDFLVVADGEGGLAGCAALRGYPATGGAPPAAVVYNVCVAPGSQGRGIGSALLRGLLRRAASEPVTAVFAATTGSGALFLRHGFVCGDGAGAPAAWLDALDPRRGSRILSRRVTGLT